MEPDYPVGSLIYVKKVNPEDIKEGDVITFYLSNGKIVATHQVYEIDREKNQFRTQGINNRDENGKIIHDGSPVKYNSLIGKVVFCIPHLGSINRMITTAPGIYIVIIGTLIIGIISLIRDYVTNKT